ncbi:MAG: hypothetical protein K0S65_6749 [Labilithrix sp.]|nr:hypothetical protein [Labilithrix sp.]
MSNPKAYILNCAPSRDTHKDWGVKSARASAAMPRAAGIPTSRDLREPWWSIGNQGATGAGVGWAAADSVLRWHFVRVQAISVSAPLSSRYVWMAAKESDRRTPRPTTFIESEGTSIKAALDVARKLGVVTDALLPSGEHQLYPGDAADFYATASRLRIASYFNLGSQLSDWREWLAFEGPILTRLDVDRTWEEATTTNGRLGIYRPDTRRGGHAVALVGYDQNGFIVRNSWGASWGDKGFAYASEAYALAAFTETYGIRL